MGSYAFSLLPVPMDSWASMAGCRQTAGANAMGRRLGGGGAVTLLGCRSACAAALRPPGGLRDRPPCAVHARLVARLAGRLSGRRLCRRVAGLFGR